MLQSGTTLGNYKILAKLGEGGMADVYEAEDVKLGRRVALKVLPPEFGRKQDLVTRFEKEVRAAASLNHHAIVTVFEVGQEQGVHFFSMRLLKGGDLRARIQRGMQEGEALIVLRQLADAFAHAHGRGFVHRDVKPENIMFDEQGNPVLTDFGIAKAMDSGTRVTATGVSIGTPRYISPEQARGKPVDARADLYSLGVILFEMLTGKPPYDGEESLAVIFKHVTEPIPRLPDSKAHLQNLVDRLMAKEPAQRPESATALIALVDELMPRSPGMGATMLNPVVGTQQNPIVANLDTGAGPALRTDERQHANALIEEHKRQQQALERRHQKNGADTAKAPAPKKAEPPRQAPPPPPPTEAEKAAERERRQREAEVLRQAREQASAAEAAAAAEASAPAATGGAWKIAVAAAIVVIALGLGFMFRDRIGSKAPADATPPVTAAPAPAAAATVETTAPVPAADPAAEEKARQAAAAEQERLRLEEEARQKAAADEAAKKTAADDAAKKAADEQRRRAEVQRQQRQAAEAERQRQAAEAARVKAAADEAAQAKAQAEEEARKRAAAEAEVKRLQEAEAAAKKKAEEQERQRAEEEETRRIIEEEIGRLRRQEEEARRRAQADAEARRKAQEQGGTTP